MHLHYIPARDDISRTEVLQDDAATHANLLRVDLHQIPRLFDSPVFRLANGPRTVSQLSPHLPQHGRSRRFVQRPAPLEIGQNASDHGGGNRAALSPQEHHQLVLAPARILLAQRQNPFGQFRRPRWLAHLVRPVRTLFQSGQIVTAESPLPAIERLPADTKVSARSPYVPAIEEVEQHPLKPGLRCPTQALPEARQLAGLGNLHPPDCSHPDTLPSVTNHSERAQRRKRGGIIYYNRGDWRKRLNFQYFVRRRALGCAWNAIR